EVLAELHSLLPNQISPKNSEKKNALENQGGGDVPSIAEELRQLNLLIFTCREVENKILQNKNSVPSDDLDETGNSNVSSDMLSVRELYQMKQSVDNTYQGKGKEWSEHSIMSPVATVNPDVKRNFDFENEDATKKITHSIISKVTKSNNNQTKTTPMCVPCPRCLGTITLWEHIQ
ncbi:hypothetical protein RFI_28163, partial [Reticulomyxa filosa]